jgi:hypothetical protein
MPAAPTHDGQGSEGHKQRLRRRTCAPRPTLFGDMWGHAACVPPDCRRALEAQLCCGNHCVTAASTSPSHRRNQNSRWKKRLEEVLARERQKQIELSRVSRVQESDCVAGSTCVLFDINIRRQSEHQGWGYLQKEDI